MKISMMSYTMDRGEWGKTHDIQELCRFTRELGIEGIDWNSTYGKDPGDIRRIMDDYGLACVCYTFFPDLNFPDKKNRQKGLDQIARGIETASILGTDKIMLPFPGKKEYSREQARKNVIAGLKDAMPLALKAKVTITVEDFPNLHSPFIISSDMLEAIKEIPELRITYDSGNFIMGSEDPLAAFNNLKKLAVFGHFKDWRIVQAETGIRDLKGRFYTGALVGEGIVDYPNLVQLMIKSGYDGYVNLEYEGSDYPPEKAMRMGLYYLQSIIQQEQPV